MEGVASYGTGQFLCGYTQGPRAAENEHTAHSSFLGELNEDWRARGGSLAEGVKTHSRLQIGAAERMLPAQFP